MFYKIGNIYRRSHDQIGKPPLFFHANGKRRPAVCKNIPPNDINSRRQIDQHIILFVQDLFQVFILHLAPKSKIIFPDNRNFFHSCPCFTQIQHFQLHSLQMHGKLRNRGYALVPLELYFDTNGRVKLTLGLGRGKKLYDKREDMARRDVDREIARALKERSR